MTAEDQPTRRVRVADWASLAVTLAIGCTLFFWFRPLINRTAPYMWLHEHALTPSRLALREVFTTPAIYAAVPFILALQWLFPARPRQRMLSVSFLQDLIWFLFDACSQVTLIAATSNLFRYFYLTHLSGFTLHSVQSLPYPLRLTLGILVADLAGWIHHFVRHKLDVLWHFHAIHHSQRELNLFTDVRYHVMEYIATGAINVLFITWFTMDPYTVTFYTVFHSWYTKLCHANIKSDFGLLKYILITPQSHRVHHSVERHHRDKNFGILLSVWDYLLGTQHRVYDEYPETGIDDDTFPHETRAAGLSLFITPVRQHVYPFLAIARQVRQRVGYRTGPQSRAVNVAD